jgi:mono/diheme cytochrome c family protein
MGGMSGASVMRWLSGMLVLALCGACANSPTQDQVEDQDLGDVPGRDRYMQLCASCHGEKARGDGPIAPLIESGVPDLTRIAQRNGGVFPAEDVRRTIDGRWDRRAHGARDMPVWGLRLYYSAERDDPNERARVDARIGELVEYLRNIQVE